MHVQVWLIICSVWLLQLNICLADMNSSKININANDSNNIPTNITKFQIKTTNSADLPKVQLQEMAMIVESNKDKSNVSVVSTSASNSGNSSGEEILRRKITPTGNIEQPVKKEQLQGGNSIKEMVNTEKVNNSSKTTKNATTSTTTTKLPVVEGAKMVAENVYVNVNGSVATKANKTLTKSPSENVQVNVNGTVTAVTVPLNIEAKKSGSESKTITDITQISTVKVTTTNAPTAAPGLNTNITNVKTNQNNSTTSSTSTTTATTTTSTTTPKPKKPTVTYGVEDFPKLEDNILELQEHTQNQQLGNDKNSSKFSTPETEFAREPPNAEPSQEFNSKLSRDNIVPIITVICTVPLTIGVIFIFYRRIKDFWSTRHYRRMDFLVDGMYND